MSRILQAMKQGGGGQLSIASRLENLGATSLFALPGEAQQAEFTALANTIAAGRRSDTGAVVAMMSTAPGEGASYVTFNVARFLAAIFDRPVAWIDANFQSPQRRLMDRQPGIRELLQDPGRLDRIASEGNFTIIPNGVAEIKTADLLNSAAYEQLLALLRQRFFVSVFDAPPVVLGLDSAHLARGADGTYLVVECGRLKYEVIQNGLRTMAEHGVDISGTVLNRRSYAIPKAVYSRL